MKTFIALLISHVVLLVMASTNFAGVSLLWGNSSFSWNWFQYRFSNGWGHAYVSDYALGQVLCYVAAYGLGLVAFAIARIGYRLRFSAVAGFVCFLGTVSFCIEVTHWLWPHNFSWIASFPSVMLVLWVCVGIQLRKRIRRDTQPSG